MKRLQELKQRAALALRIPPAAAPITKSRNQREGEYAGRSRYYPAAGEIGRPHHCRAGNGAIRRTSLREWSRRP